MTTPLPPLPPMEETLRRVKEARSLTALEALRVSLLGRKSAMAAHLRLIGQLPPKDRAARGNSLNESRQTLTEALETRKSVLTKEAREKTLVQNAADITLPVAQPPFAFGRLHPIAQAWDEMVEIFASLGFSLEEGPEIETEEHNFTALNTPEEHPARDPLDTFYFPSRKDGKGGSAPPHLLRCHTSPVQIRAMRAGAPPFRFIAPGRVYRRDSDQTHTPMFHQIEGLVIDRDCHLGHLKWVLTHFLRAFFENDAVEIRFRPHHFPFTEPSLEADMSYRREGGRIIAGGDGGGGGGEWMEILGCGMVHPHVLEASGLDAREWQGFAFGTGIDRLAMLKYGIPDLRQCFDANLDWLDFYGVSPLFAPSLSGGLSPKDSRG